MPNEFKPGDKIKFNGLYPRPWETIGVIADTHDPKSEYARVVWNTKPGEVKGLHASQILLDEGLND